MQRRIVIRGTQLGGYPFVLILVALPVLLTISIWLYPRELARWLISAGVLFIADLVLEAIGRRTFVEVDGERIRWSFRQPPSRGDEPIGNLRSVTIYPASGALLEFASGSDRVVLGADDFRTRDIMRVVEALRGTGVRVDDSRGPMECLLNILRGKSSARR